MRVALAANLVVQAITNLAQALKMTTTAEGIETEQQCQKVRELGCTEMQGYLFSPPRPVHEINQLFVSTIEQTANAA